MTDRLTSAISAARTRADENAEDGAATRLRIRETLAKRGGVRRKKWTLLAAVIGTLFGSTAFALHQGWEPPWASHAAAVETAPIVERPKVAMQLPTPEQPFVAPPDRETASAREEPEALAWSSAPMPRPLRPRPRAVATNVGSVALATPPPPPDSTPPTPTIGAGPSRVATAVHTDSPAPGLERELAAYRVAHLAHFRGNDPEAALVAWDHYLAKFPDGRMALDARYDRALVLVKLERWKDAREALASFAAANSTYRKTEAAKILDAIRAR